MAKAMHTAKTNNTGRPKANAPRMVSLFMGEGIP
jgi:hypothetical protein